MLVESKKYKMEHKFKKGDVVQLKSGGPIMTVYGGKRHLVCCVWFEHSKREKADFEPETLKLSAE